MHDEVNDLSPWALEIQVLNLQETCRIWDVSRLVATLTKGVSISVTGASPTAATGDHCSAEMSFSLPLWKWLRMLSHFTPCNTSHKFLYFSLFQFSLVKTHSRTVSNIRVQNPTHTVQQSSNPPSSDGRPWVLALVSAGKICLPWNMNL